MVITPEQMSAITGYTSTAAIARWCERNGVKYLVTNAGIVTTIDALNFALGVTPPQNTPVKHEF